MNLANLIEHKPMIKIDFFDLQFKNESIYIMIDYYTGLFKVLMPNYLNGSIYISLYNLKYKLNPYFKIRRVRFEVIFRELHQFRS